MACSKGLIVVGAGGHGRQVVEAVLLAGEHTVVGLVDDGAQPPADVWGHPLLGRSDDLPALQARAAHAVVAIGDNRAREALTGRLRELGFNLVTLIHPEASVSPRAKLGPGCMVMAGARVGTEAQLGEGVIVNSGAVLDHHCRADDFAHLGVGVVMAGGTRVGRGAWLRAGCVLGYGATVADGVLLPPGTVLGE